MTTNEEHEERAELARRQLSSYVALSQHLLELMAAIPADATAPTLREALRNIFEVVLEATIMRGRDFGTTLGFLRRGPRGTAP